MLEYELQLTIFAGRPFTVNWLKLEDVEAIEWKAEWYEGIDLRSSPPEKLEQFLGVALKGILIGINRGAYAVSDEWNRLLQTTSSLRLRTSLGRCGEGNSNSPCAEIAVC